ncbi:hypothetical protein [Rhodobacter ferrooxidans]|uniref:Uncharacterized protein n=1 Tax=Rhodobacter ferrooxidans TaxID=371731 RepID=C8RWF8_9RHOB|nr:hypothetical protein [Rhodobacter sp. SW2]EEW26901.1 hypothetical protein Rsw2DRAFT_0136 [Rhodobacter sp. SW2]
MVVGVAAFVGVWWLVYRQLIPATERMVSLLPVARHSQTGEAQAFFFYDTPKMMQLLTPMVFGMGVVRCFFSPERTRALLAGKREGVGNVLAAAGIMLTGWQWLDPAVAIAVSGLIAVTAHVTLQLETATCARAGACLTT